MEVAVKSRIWFPVVLLALFALCLFGSPARAQEPRIRAQQLVRDKILHDARDRYDVKFLTTNTQRIGVRWIRVSGRGSFRRRGKPLQYFLYHVKVNPKTPDSSELGYNLR